jgi:lysophospholipase L1-like esterase
MRVRRLIHALGFGCLLVVGAEIASRLDDWIRYGTPLLVSPSRERDLVQAEPWGCRGRPGGQFRKWKLDSDGFRETPSGPGVGPHSPRLLVLGASETFGLYESPDQEYPAQLARLLQKKEPCRVINASMAGITLKSLVVYWDHWAGNFHADRVLIYPTPQFYLDNEPPQLPKSPAEKVEDSRPSAAFRPRLLDRGRDLYHQLPEWLKAYREEWVIRREAAGQGDGWLFTTVPEDRLSLFEDDLVRLVAHIRERGAEPVLLTHAASACSPPRTEDETYIRRMRMFFPRATPSTLLAFEQRANDVIRRLAKKEGLFLIDVDRELSGRHELFADLFHFNDAGAAKMAELLADRLPPLGKAHTLVWRGEQRP